MVYLVVALGQLGVILLTAMAEAAGLIVGTTALLTCVVTALAVALHAAHLHLVRRPAGREADEQGSTRPRSNAPLP